MALNPYFITAIPTPLEDDDCLHADALHKEIDEQFDAGINGLLIAGTMGCMQLLPDKTYGQLVESGIEFAASRGEILVGAGDSSFGRTLDRIKYLNTLPVDGVVVLAPYVTVPSQEELIDYYRALADASRAPLFLYDIPQLTRAKLEIHTVITLSQHPNIKGIKCSDDPAYMRQLIDLTDGRFRVVMASVLLLDTFLRQGFREHLDGIFCLFPRHIVALGRASEMGDWCAAAEIQQGINRTVRLVRSYALWPAITVLMNELGTPGRFRPRPYRTWNSMEISRFLEDPETQIVMEFLSGKTNVREHRVEETK